MFHCELRPLRSKSNKEGQLWLWLWLGPEPALIGQNPSLSVANSFMHVQEHINR